MVFAANQRKVKASFTASATHASTRRRRRAKPPRSSPNALLSEEFCSKARPRRARQLLRERPASDSLLVRSLTFSSFWTRRCRKARYRAGSAVAAQRSERSRRRGRSWASSQQMPLRRDGSRTSDRSFNRCGLCSVEACAKASKRQELLYCTRGVMFSSSEASFFERSEFLIATSKKKKTDRLCGCLSVWMFG